MKIVVSATSEKRDRILSEEQLYSKMFYETRIKAHVDQKMLEGDGSETRLKVLNETVKAMWKDETKETKAEVRAERARLVEEKRQREEELARYWINLRRASSSRRNTRRMSCSSHRNTQMLTDAANLDSKKPSRASLTRFSTSYIKSRVWR